jgi:hypothetical protein
MENIRGGGGGGFEKSKEMLRYYLHDGKIAHLPVLHFSPFVPWYFTQNDDKVRSMLLVLPRVSRRNASVSSL